MRSRSEHALDENGRSIALRRLRADIARNRLIVGPAIEPKHYRSAAKLLRLHGVSRGLRTLDALQLAIALDMLEAFWIFSDALSRQTAL